MTQDINETEATEHAIQFFADDIDFELDEPDAIRAWIEATIVEEKKRLSFINYIFCDDEYLLQINIEHLQHDFYTDIITFPYSATAVESDIFVSIDRVRENAKDLGITFQNELHRVLIHGALHLCGHKDESDEDEANMRQKENYYLQKRTGMILDMI
jgi:probable rRNA maturation factor